MSRLYTILISLIVSLTTLSQNKGINLSGKVIDENGEPLIGVNVFEMETVNGTVTDINGQFTLNVANSKAVVTFTYIGMVSQEITVGKNRKLNITLFEDTQMLDPVVVIGYGQAQKSDLTGASTSISEEDINRLEANSLEDILQNFVPGMSFTQDDGAPGSEFNMKIRGSSSTGNSGPLFVIDGVIMDDGNGNISPREIASIEVLKDASSTAIYGSRGANGVIIITTKKGFQGKPRIEFSANVGFRTTTREYDMQNSLDYAYKRYQSNWIYRRYDSFNASEFSNYEIFRDSPNDDANYWMKPRSGTYTNWETYSDSTTTNWQDAMYRDALLHNYNLSISGGTRTNKFSISANYANQAGIMINSGYEKFGARVNVEQNINKKSKIGLNISYTYTSSNGYSSGSSDGIVIQMLRQQPTMKITENNVLNNDDVANQYLASNPYEQANSITKQYYKNSIVGRLNYEYNIHKNWILKLNGNYTYNTSRNSAYYPRTVQQGIKQNGRATQDRSESRKYTGEALLHYSNSYNDIHRFNGMLGATIEGLKDNYLYAENHNFPIDAIAPDNIGLGTDPVIPRSSINRNPYQLLSFLGRGFYSYDNKYLTTLTIRADGCSRFGDSHKWGAFPSIGFAWRAGEETFIKELNIFDNFKVRANWGISGNMSIPAYTSLITLSAANVPLDGQNLSGGVAVDRPMNDNLGWETTAQYGIGVDLGFLKNSVNIVIDWYLKHTDGLFLNYNAPLYSGYSRSYINVGSVQNTGIEIAFNYRIIQKKDWGLSTTFTIASNQSKALSVPNGELFFDPRVASGSGNMVVVRNGERLGQWYGYKVDGVFTSQSEIDALPDSFESFAIKKSKLRPGDHKFNDYNNDGKIDANDKQVLGCGEPMMLGTFGLRGNWKGIAINTVFQFSIGATIFNANLVTLESGRDSYNSTTRIKDSFSPTLYHNTTKELVEVGNPNGTHRIAGGNPENYLTSQFLFDGSYLRFSDLTLSYSLDKKSIAKAKVFRALKFYTTIKNIFILTSYYGYDPEVNTRQGGLGDLMSGLDYSSYPRTRSYNIGVRASF